MEPNEPPHATSSRPRGWHSRGYLPHFDAGSNLTQFVTFRLADSVPDEVIARWHEELSSRPGVDREAELHRLIEAFLDTGCGSCHLSNVSIATTVEGTLLHFDAIRYTLSSWVIMPNHVHVLFTPVDGRSLSDIVGGWKSYTAKEANRLLGRRGRFWQEDYFDRYVRNEHHFARVTDYVEMNPVRAGLCKEPNGWQFGSARLRRAVEAAELREEATTRST